MVLAAVPAKGGAATTPSSLETSPTKEIGTIPANPLAFIVMIRL